MKLLIYLSFLMIVLLSCNQTSPIPDSGVPRALAADRKNHVSEIEYRLLFDIPDSKTEDVLAQEVMQFRFSGNTDLFLDFKEKPANLKRIIINGQQAPIGITNEHIMLPRAYLQEYNKVDIEFVAGNLSLNRNEEYLYTLLVPDRARTVFPVMDQPNLKARYRLTLQLPADWEAVTNAPVESVHLDQGLKTITYSETEPVSSYLFAFASGRFKKLTGKEGDMTMYYRESDSVKVARNAPEIFELHFRAVEWLEQYTGIKYPFQKFDFALIPAFQYGGMEHPGSIFYRENALMLDESASINQKLRRASLIAHETAHMWFGDLVTMDWFDDVWLKEVFANFMAAKIINPSFPEINHDLRFLLSHYPAAYEVDRTQGTHAIQQSLDNLQNAGSLYGSIIYQKAPIVMRNLESIIGEEQFRKGLQDYLHTYAYRNATWDDLIDILEKYTSQDLSQWNRDWVKTGGMPVIRVTRDVDMMLYQVQASDHGQTWPQKLKVLVGRDSFDFHLNESYRHQVFDGDLVINSDGRGYGFFDLDPSLESELAKSLTSSDELIRASSWIMNWEIFLHNFYARSDLPDQLIGAVRNEDNPLILDYLMGCLQTVYWHFLSENQRILLQETLENVLYRGMTGSDDPSFKRIFYEGYSAMVQSDSGLKNLHRLWSEELKEFALPLSENDKIRLTLQLVIREVSGAQEIMKTQLDQVLNPDNKRRLEFLLPAVVGDETIRDAFFQSLLDVENRDQEPWVSEALSYLHHPLRSGSSLRYLKPGLEIIQEIKETGDIFFPKAWLDASLGGHHSEEAAGIVRDFLEQSPDLPSDLRNKILQSADILLRINKRN